MNTQNINEDKVRYVAACCGPNGAWRSAFWGSVLILLGGLGLLSTFVPLQNVGRSVLPALLVLWGGFILFRRGRVR